MDVDFSCSRRYRKLPGSHSLPLTLFNPECNPSSRIPINRRALVAETIQNIDDLKIRAEELQKEIDDTWRYL